MQIRVITDNHITPSEERNGRIEAALDDALSRFGDRVTRVEVHLSDQNSDAKSGSADKRCTMEARLAGLQPVTVSEASESIEQAYNGAVDKLQKTLDRTIGKRDNPRKRTSFSGDQVFGSDQPE